jgi:hypothetical protein
MPRPLRRIKKLSMYKALKVGYLRNEKRQARKLKKYGYVLDKELSNNERMVAYSPFTKKVIFVENGSQTSILNPSQLIEDWRNNLVNVSTGTFTYTPRFQEAKNTYLKAKKKYGEETPFKLVGHSQAAISVNELAGSNDKGYTYNGALFTKTKDNPNVTNYRTRNDLVSAFANPNDMRTLSNSSSSQNPIAAHNIENIQNLPVFI